MFQLLYFPLLHFPLPHFQRPQLSAGFTTIDVDWVDERRLEPLCPHPDTTLQYYKPLRIQLPGILQLPVPCNCALKLYTMSWFCQNLSSRDLNVLVVLADTTQFCKLFHVFITLFVKPNFRKSYFTWDFWSLSSFPFIYIRTSCGQRRCNTCMIFWISFYCVESAAIQWRNIGILSLFQTCCRRLVGFLAFSGTFMFQHYRGHIVGYV